jgi:hypothetical protein
MCINAKKNAHDSDANFGAGATHWAGKYLWDLGGTVKQDNKHVDDRKLPVIAETGVFRFVYMATLTVACFQVVALLWARWVVALASC